mgnify:CR=1 FL=1
MKTISANEKLDVIIASVEKSGIKAAKLIENLKAEAKTEAMSYIQDTMEEAKSTYKTFSKTSIFDFFKKNKNIINENGFI